MKVILLKDVAKIGQKGSVKEVSDGYALNYLIPHGLAEQATPGKIAAHEATQKKEEAARAMEVSAVATTVKSVEGAKIQISARATEKGGLFKAITREDIAKALLDQRRAKLSPDAIALEKPIKEVGEHPITIKASGAEAHIMLSIEPQSS